MRRALVHGALMAGLSVLLTGCAAAHTAATPAPIPADASAAERVAAALAQADDAASAPEIDAARLAQALAQIDGLGARHTADVGDADPLPGWSARLAATGTAPPPLRGRALGPAYRKGVVAPGQSVMIEQVFLGGKTARVAVASPGGRPLALRISDPTPTTICDAAAAPRRACEWMPLFTQRFAITLTNGGTAPTRYYLVVD